MFGCLVQIGLFLKSIESKPELANLWNTGWRRMCAMRCLGVGFILVCSVYFYLFVVSSFCMVVRNNKPKVRGQLNECLEI